ncbi:MAG: iron-containing alcohol dehydrogenase [Armatimonadota bacterium]|nr:iron-containing alcohol dehydrogenase [Armatimonadota bacterium]
MQLEGDGWRYWQPTEIVFGPGVRRQLPGVVSELGESPVLVTDSGLAELPLMEEIRGILGPDAPLFAEVEPNPTVGMVDALVKTIRDEEIDVVVAAGGGSSMDCAKVACSVAVQGGLARQYHSEGATLDDRHLPLIAMPTTAGTGSEVTPNAVLGDPEKGVKAPLVHDNFYPTVALIDADVTASMPPMVTASTGFDALAHAVEGYWSKNHQPICDLFALEAVRLVFEHLPGALQEPGDMEAREGMSMAALLGGLAFQAPQNAAVHACSFPFSATYHLPHGTACAMTLDHFIRFNAPAMGERGQALARAAGCGDMLELADEVARMKAASPLPTTLDEIGVEEEDIDEIVESSFHPLMDNNPREVAPDQLREIYRSML